MLSTHYYGQLSHLSHLDISYHLFWPMFSLIFQTDSSLFIAIIFLWRLLKKLLFPLGLLRSFEFISLCCLLFLPVVYQSSFPFPSFVFTEVCESAFVVLYFCCLSISIFFIIFHYFFTKNAIYLKPNTR